MNPVKVLVRVLDRFQLTGPTVDTFSRLKYLLNWNLQAKNREVQKKAKAEGLPYPPPRLVYYVTNEFDLADFQKKGEIGAACIRSILGRNRFDISAFRTILDFGCGCGRMMRQWAGLTGPALHGTDYNPALVDWCRRTLRFAKFQTNQLKARLAYEPESFDFIYAISVFTHLSEGLQSFWIQELSRILRKGGVFYLTTHGRNYLPFLNEERRQRFEAGELVVIRAGESGANICAVFHPESWVRKKLAAGFRVLDFEPDGAKDCKQDAYLLQKL